MFIKTPTHKHFRHHLLWRTDISLPNPARLAAENILLHFSPWVVQMDWSVTCTSLPLPCNINAFCHVWVLAWCLMLLPFAHYIFLPCSLHEHCACLLALHTIQWSGAHFTQPKAFQQGKRINFNTAYTYIKSQISSPDILKSISCLCTIVW